MTCASPSSAVEALPVATCKPCTISSTAIAAAFKSSLCATPTANLPKILAQEVQGRLGNTPTIYTDYEEMLKAEKLDGVDICLPHGLHHGVSIACMEAGVDVLTEKPIGVSIRAGKLMQEAAAAHRAHPLHRRPPSPQSRPARGPLGDQRLRPDGQPAHLLPQLHPPARTAEPQPTRALARCMAARPPHVGRRHGAGQRLPLLGQHSLPLRRRRKGLCRNAPAEDPDSQSP